ncbi:hypothetical protein HDU67_010264 [Dinochytrium kinnereticum]|nr:hypothetical protein HDU67_010264 [Dinochytrium kinnereticum]
MNKNTYRRVPSNPSAGNVASDATFATGQMDSNSLFTLNNASSQMVPARAAGKPAEGAQRMPKRTTKTSQKLALFPEDVLGVSQLPPEDISAVSLSQGHSAHIPPPLPHVVAKTAKEDLFYRVDKTTLPRATAYCTANSYKMDLLFEYLKSISSRFQTDPQRFDEAIYTPFRPEINEALEASILGQDLTDMISSRNADISDFKRIIAKDSSSHTDGDADFDASAQRFEDGRNDNVISVDFQAPLSKTAELILVPKHLLKKLSYYKNVVRRSTTPELFFFDYGVVVMWGLDEEEELRVLKDIRPYEDESIDHSDVEAEKFHYFYSRNQQPRIFNDIITLVSPTSSKMIKLTISHAFAQSVKLTLFEGLIEESIESTKHIPFEMAETGKINMHRKAINQKIGEVYGNKRIS